MRRAGASAPAIHTLSFPDLRAFIDRLRRDGDLVTVESQVDPHLEVAEIHRRVVAGGGPALLFTNVRSEEHTSELQSLRHLVCRLLLEKKKKKIQSVIPNRSPKK